MNDFMNKLDTPGADLQSAASDLKSKMGDFNQGFTSQVSGQLNNVTSGLSSATQTVQGQLGNYTGTLNSISSNIGQFPSVSLPSLGSIPSI
jgi:uncharacterized phage infection (PIP) family protein YhgE